MFAFDPLYLLLMLPALLAWWAQARVSEVYKEYGKTANGRGLNGKEAAKLLLAHNGLTDVATKGREAPSPTTTTPRREPCT